MTEHKSNAMSDEFERLEDARQELRDVMYEILTNKAVEYLRKTGYKRVCYNDHGNLFFQSRVLPESKSWDDAWELAGEILNPATWGWDDNHIEEGMEHHTEFVRWFEKFLYACGREASIDFEFTVKDDFGLESMEG